MSCVSMCDSFHQMTHPTNTQRQDDAAKIVYVVSKQTQFIVVETVRHVWHCSCTWDGYVGKGNAGCTHRQDAGHDGDLATHVDPPLYGDMGDITHSVEDNSGNTDANAEINQACTTTSNQPVDLYVGESEEYQDGENEDIGEFMEKVPRQTTAPASNISTRRSKLSSKRRRRKVKKAQRKLQGKLDEQALDALWIEANDPADAYLATQGLSNGNPVREYLRLLKKVHYWARKYSIEPVEALEDIENWSVRSLDAHPAAVEVKELLELTSNPSPFEKAWKHLAPQILDTGYFDKETVDDVASEKIADLYNHMLTYWDDSIGYGVPETYWDKSDDSDMSSGYRSEKDIYPT